MGDTTASRAVASTVYLIVIQIVSRGLTFIGNQALLRYVSPHHLGLAVQLEALSVSVLYTSRESLRVALQRLPQKTAGSSHGVRSKQLQSAVNSGYLVVTIGALLGTIVGSLYLYPAGPELLHSTHFKPAFWLYAFATIIELLSEPGFIVIQQNALFNVRARAETSAAISRCIAACSGAILMHRLGSPMSVLPFAIGQVCYAISLITVYYWSALSVASSDGFSMLPQKLGTSPEILMSAFSKPLLTLAGAFYGQSIFKWLLTQGDTLVMSLFADLKAQGIFALASNYGGLASRLLFQPVEESSRNVFGGLLTHEEAVSAKPLRSQAHSSSITSRRQQALSYLSTTLRLYILVVFMPCIAILPQVFPILISTLLGPKSQWNSLQTVSLLQVYSYYIPALAINGILDAFVASIATEAELGAQSIMMLGVTMIYLGAAYFSMTVMQLGAVGLVYANILNMSLRIIFSLWFIRAWTKQNLPTRLGDKQSAFGNFCQQSLPTGACLVSFSLTLLGLYGESYVKDSFAGNATVTELSRVKLGSIDLDLFHISYLFSAAVVLLSSIVLTELGFLVSTVEPILPMRVRNAIQPYLQQQPREQAQKDK